MSDNCRVFIGRVSNRVSERDVEKFFRDFKVRDVVLKQGFGFVELDTPREADDAIYELNGKDLCGTRVVVEMSNRRGSGRGGRGGYSGSHGGRGNGGGGGGGFPPRRGGFPAPTRYRLIVQNLSTRCKWQDLKDMMRGCSYANAHNKRENEGIVCFDSYSDLKSAIKKHQGKEINGRKIKLVDDTPASRSRSRSRSARSRSRTASSHESRSRSPLPKKAKRSDEKSGSESD